MRTAHSDAAALASEDAAKIADADRYFFGVRDCDEREDPYELDDEPEDE